MTGLEVIFRSFSWTFFLWTVSTQSGELLDSWQNFHSGFEIKLFVFLKSYDIMSWSLWSNKSSCLWALVVNMTFKPQRSEEVKLVFEVLVSDARVFENARKHDCSELMMLKLWARQAVTVHLHEMCLFSGSTWRKRGKGRCMISFSNRNSCPWNMTMNTLGSCVLKFHSCTDVCSWF